MKRIVIVLFACFFAFASRNAYALDAVSIDDDIMTACEMSEVLRFMGIETTADTSAACASYSCTDSNGNPVTIEKKKNCDKCDDTTQCKGCCATFCTTDQCKTRCCAQECGTDC